MDSFDYKKIFSNNLNNLLLLNNKTQNDIVNDLSFNKSAVSTWCNGTRLPRMDKVEMLAKYFHVEKSDLIEKKEEDYHSEEYKFHTNLCEMNYKGVMFWTEDKLLEEYETVILRAHFDELLGRYKEIIEKTAYAQSDWKKNKEEIINFYKGRNSDIATEDIHQIFIKQTIDSYIDSASKWLQNLPNWILTLEFEYESNKTPSDKNKSNFIFKPNLSNGEKTSTISNPSYYDKKAKLTDKAMELNTKNTDDSIRSLDEQSCTRNSHFSNLADAVAFLKSRNTLAAFNKDKSLLPDEDIFNLANEIYEQKIHQED
ncbi:MAG: helix-turn-helix transcriptional regulator [Hungatella sp.]|nr:helix-turn-helix transcriptional regulator [Hungatella sp.]